MFSPRAIALVGASGDETKNTARPQRYLRKHGYEGKIAPINPSRSEILGLACYSKLVETPYPIDHAFIMVEDVENALEDCGRKGVPVYAIYRPGSEPQLLPEILTRDTVLTALGIPKEASR